MLSDIAEGLVNVKTDADFIETAVWNFIDQTIRDEQNRRDPETINRCADRLNEEAEDVLAS